MATFYREMKMAKKASLNAMANMTMIRSHYEKKIKSRALNLASLKMEKPHTADKKELSEKEVKEILEQAQKDLNIAMREARKILSEDLVYTIRKQAFYASIAVEMKKVVTLEVPIAAVNIIHAVSHLYINPITYPRMSKPERIAVLIHEVLHLALFHIFRYLELPEEGRHHYMWNLATDCAINQMIPNNAEIHLPEGCILPSSFEKQGIKMPPNLSAEEYYKILKENQDKLSDNMKSGMEGDGGECPQCGGTGKSNPNSNQDDQEKSDGQGEGGGEGSENQEKEDASGSGGDSKEGEGSQDGDEQPCSCCGGTGKQDNKSSNWHSKWGETEGSDKVNKAAVKKTLKKGYMKHAGTMPGNLKSAIEKIIESKIDWRQKFGQYWARFVQSFHVSTYKRESRRLGELAKGRRKKRKLSVVVCVDTSASVTDEHLAQFTGQIVKMYKADAKITIIECDTQIYDVYEFKGQIKRLEYKGRGGTSFIPPFEKIQNEKMEADLVIYLTDGYGTAPDKFNIPTLWVLTEGGATPTDTTGSKVSWGEVLYMN